MGAKLNALVLFFEAYLINEAPWASSVRLFFEGNDGKQCSSNALKEAALKHTNRSDNIGLSMQINHVVTFLEWVLDAKYSRPNPKGQAARLLKNPLRKLKRTENETETVHSPMPYRYIQQLRSILCPNPRGSFRDWLWAQKSVSEHKNSNGDWFEVPYEMINKQDPDCVWKTKTVQRKKEGEKGSHKVTVYLMWCPVRAMVIFIKLHLPLRTYQVRMLDSGEADTWRYEYGAWLTNKEHSFVLGDCNHPYSKGVFKRFYDSLTEQVTTGLFINTNKTADIGKDEFERGFTIPWDNKDVLYWLNRLRNWQESYNPIKAPLECTELNPKFTGSIKSGDVLLKMGRICFLFRNRSSKYKEIDKPIPNGYLTTFWYRLLSEFEDQLYQQGDTLTNGERKQLVVRQFDDNGNEKSDHCITLFPLHSLRVSLITCYATDSKIPISVISTLLAGHSKILTSCYYTRLSPSVMSAKMEEAHKKIQAKEHQSLSTFLKDAELRQIKKLTVFNDEDSIHAAIVNRNPVGWECRYIGLCLVGGNTVKTNELNTIGGCWNGGAILKDGKNPRTRIHDMVPHGPENCVRCRWFITDARYQYALGAHLNLMSFKASEAATLADSLEREVEALSATRFNAESAGQVFTKYDELQALQRRYEKQIVESNLFIEDWVATMQLILRIIDVENARGSDVSTNKMIAVGTEDDLKVSFVETDSRLLQLSLICDDAEYYPDMLDDIKKTGVIQDRTQVLSRAMLKKGYQPNLLLMNTEQQLIAGNAFFRQVAKSMGDDDGFKGFRKAADYLELEKFMKDDGIFKDGISALSRQCEQPLLRLT